MGSKTTISIECDICDKPAKTYADESAARKDGWVLFGWEGHYIDRDFHQAAVCPSCANSIAANKPKG